MARRKHSTRYRVTTRKGGSGLIYIVDAADDVAALVTSGKLADAHLMAAGPELYQRLVEVKQLRQRHDGQRTRPLLPAEVIASIEATLAQARGAA